MSSEWRQSIPQADWELYQAAGFGAEQELGTRPAVLVVDVTRGFVGAQGSTGLEAVREYRNACGESAFQALPVIARVLEAARAAGVRVYYTRGRSSLAVTELGAWASKNARAQEDLRRGEDVHRIVDEVAPAPGDLVFEKEKPSAFFGTSLAAHLVQDRIDSLIVTGCTTSGCVRASVVDAFSLNYRVMVVEDAVFDRGRLSHAVGLFDMHAKYAQVAPVDVALVALT